MFPKVIGWLVWMRLMSAFELWCKFLEKMNTFLISWYFFFLLLGSVSAVSQNLCLSGLDFGDSLAQGNKELWRSQNLCLSGSDFGDSLAQGNEELWHSQNSCLSGLDLVILWPKVMNNYGAPEICVFLHPENAQISCCG